MRDGSDFRNQMCATGEASSICAHAVAAHFLHRDFDAALLADDALVLHALVLAAQAFVILHRPEDARAEQSVALGLEGAVVDRLRLLDLAMRPAQDLIRAGERNLDPVEGRNFLAGLEDVHQLLIHLRAFLFRLAERVLASVYLQTYVVSRSPAPHSATASAFP